MRGLVGGSELYDCCCIFMCLLDHDCLYGDILCLVWVEAVLLYVVGQDTRCGPAVSRRHGGSVRRVGLRR